MKISLSKLKESIEYIFVFIVLQLCSGAILQILTRKSGVAGDNLNGSLSLQILWLAIYIIALLLALRQWKKFIYIITRNKLLLLLIGIVLFSIFWSVAPQISLRRSVALVGTTLIGMYLATRYSPSQLLRIIAWTFSIGAILSVVFALAFPFYGLHGSSLSSPWRGIYRHKNLLGRLMVLNAGVLLLLEPSNRKYRWLLWTGIGLSVGLLLLCQAKTSLVTFLSLLILIPIYKALRWNYTVVLPFLIVAVNMGGIITVWLVDNLETVLTALGKDSTLTGRTPLWAAVINKIQERPLLGYGYGAFWLGLDGESADIWQIEWNAPNSHNGVLDVWLDLGFLGISVFFLGFIIAFIQGVKWLRSTKTVEPLFILVYLTQMLVDSQTTANILTQNDIFWVLYVAIVLSIPRSCVNQSIISHKGMLKQDEAVKDV